MKFSCLKERIVGALASAERFTGKNITLPVLGSVLFEIKAGALVLTATNLEYAAQFVIPGKVFAEGKISIPAKTISALVQSIPDEKIEFEAKQTNLYIKTGDKTTRINGSPADDFPLLPKIKKVNQFSVQGAVLCSGLERVLPAVSVSDFKPEFSGILFKITPNSLHLVATDTFRLAEKKIELENKGEEAISFILPKNVAQEISKVFNQNSLLEVIIGENQVLFQNENISVISHLIDGTFPNYNNIIPKNFEISCFLNRSELKDSLRTASIFTSKLYETTLSFYEKKLLVATANPEVGEYNTNIPIKTEQDKKNLRVSFNIRYLSDGINSLSGEEIFFGCNSENTPSLFCDKEDNSFLYVLMPIRLT